MNKLTYSSPIHLLTSLLIIGGEIGYGKTT